MSVKQVLREFWNFIKSPNDMQYDMDRSQKWSFFFKIFFIDFIYHLIIILPLLYLIDEIIFIKGKSYESLTYGLAFFAMVLFAPITEELIFRYHLRYKGWKKKYFSIDRWNKIFPMMVYISAILFGLVHSTNYSNSETLFYILIPFITLSQIGGGFLLSFVRVRLSFKWAWFLHLFWNFFVFAITAIAQEKYSFSDQNYTLSMTATSFFKSEEEKELCFIKKNDTIYELNTSQKYFQQVLDTLYGSDKYNVGNYVVDIRFFSKNGLPKDSLLNLFMKEYDIREIK